METLNEVRALLTRQQAEKLATEKQLHETRIGTKEFGDLRSKVQQLQHDCQLTQQRLKSMLQGGQPSLF